jgi:hypothetical protein
MHDLVPYPNPNPIDRELKIFCILHARGIGKSCYYISNRYASSPARLMAREDNGVMNAEGQMMRK